MTDHQYENRLISETSPYLLQHAHNPVNWYPWCEEAFEEAKQRDVPVFLSSGYSSCHWCHVMAHESFEDEQVAQLLNSRYVCIKIDREERPDLDHFYMEACTALTGQGGWPLTIFLNHDKTPFFAGTYFPKNDHYGNIGLVSLLTRINELWTDRRDTLMAAGQDITRQLELYQTSAVSERPEENLTQKAYEQFAGAFDPQFGGFHYAPKFPSVHQLTFLLRYGKLNPASKATAMVEKTLAAMAAGGIFDHIGGGFFRYSTDQQWLVPHFEKMLYDNAMLTLVYGEATAGFEQRYGEIARRIVRYVCREMREEGGAFYTAQDADSAGEEGGTYLWTKQEIIHVLGETDGNRFCSEFDITEKGNFEGKNIPNRIGKEQDMEQEFAQRCFSALLAERQKRIQPMRDDKILVSSNGLMIAALASAGRLLNEPDWIEMAGEAADFILDKLVYGDRLLTGWRDGTVKHNATLDDYAYLVWGLLELYESTYLPKWIGLALTWTDRMLELFGDDHGGLFLSGKDVSDVPIRQKVFSDSAIPSGNAIAAINLIRLSSLCVREDLKKHAQRILNAASGLISQAPIGYSGLLSALLLLDSETELTVTAGNEQEHMVQLLSGYFPFLTSAVFKEEYAILEPKFHDKKSVDGKATAYLCDKKGCRPPINDYKQLESMLKKISP